MNRRTITLIAATCALAVPATAAANRVEFGLTAPEPSVSFVAKLVNNEVVSVKKFVFFDIPLTCDQGTLVVENEGEPLPKMGVSKDRFRDKFTSNNGQTVNVSGEFRKKGKKAEGTLRIQGDFVDTTGVAFTNCDSGKVEWKAGT